MHKWFWTAFSAFTRFEFHVCIFFYGSPYTSIHFKMWERIPVKWLRSFSRRKCIKSDLKVLLRSKKEEENKKGKKVARVDPICRNSIYMTKEYCMEILFSFCCNDEYLRCILYSVPKILLMLTIPASFCVNTCMKLKILNFEFRFTRVVWHFSF